MISILTLYLVGGGLLVALSLPLLFDKIPPNPLYGFRVPKTLNDPKIWYAANRYSARWLLGAGASILIAAVLFYFIPGITLDVYALGCLGVSMVALTVGLWKSFLYLRNL